MSEITTDRGVLEQVYDDVLHPSFPAAELLTRPDFLDACQRGEYEVIAATGPDGVRGAIVGQRHGAAVLVSWLAVGARGRGGGVGGGLLDAGVTRWLSQPGTMVVLAEVERPDVFAPHPVHGDPQRRLAFYARTAAGVVDIPYFQPAAGAGLPRVHGLLLTVVGTSAPGAAPRPLTPAEAVAVTGYLHGVMGDDPAGAAIITAATRPEGMRLLPMADYASVPLSGGLSPRS